MQMEIQDSYENNRVNFSPWLLERSESQFSHVIVLPESNKEFSKQSR